jgi:hypothetical protein
VKKHRREAILISFLNEKERYKRLAEYIVHLIKPLPQILQKVLTEDRV